MKILRLPDVLGIIGVSRSKLYADIKSGAFPFPISLGPRAVGWLDTEIEAWIAGRVQMARNSAPRAAPKAAA